MYLSINLSMYIFIYLPYISIVLMPPNSIPSHLLGKAIYSDPLRLPADIDQNASKIAMFCHLFLQKEQRLLIEIIIWQK